jgi:predicted TIM-barrel fold metal-dependent hydrolase
MAEVSRRYPGKFGLFCTVEPTAEAAPREIERCVRELGFIGVKIHPWLQAFSVVGTQGIESVMETAGALKVPVLFHDGTPPYSTPRQIGYLAERHPRTTVILGHAGLADLWRDAADVARLNPNVWLQPTMVPVFVIAAAFAAVGTERLLFGTDSGFGSARVIRLCLNRFVTALGKEAAEKVIRLNPQRLKSR